MFRLLHARRLTQHPLRTALSTAGIAIGTALIVAVLGMFGSITTSVEMLAETSGDADLEVVPATDTGLPESLVAEIATVDGVQRAAPLIRSRVGIAGTSAVLFGADERARDLGAAFAGCRPQSALPDPAGIVLADPLARRVGVNVGDTVAVQRPGGRAVDVRVIATVGCDEVRRVNRGLVAAAVLPTAQRLLGRPARVDSILVTTDATVRRDDVEPDIAALVGSRAVLWSPADRAAEARQSLRPVQDGSLMVAVMAVVVAGFLVFNAMSMAALERRRELATLRALGGRRRALMTNFLAESAVLGVVGSAAGIATGVVIARRLVDWIPPFFIDMFGVEPSFSLPPAALPSALAVGVGASVLAAWLPARSVVRIDPVEAMKPEGVLEAGEAERSANRILVGVGAVLFAASSIAAIAGDEQLTIIATALVLLSAVLSTAGAMSQVARAGGRAATLVGTVGRLAGTALERAPRRAWSTTLAVAMAVAVVVATVGLLENQRIEFADRIAPLAKSDLVVQTASFDSIPVDILMPLEWADRIERMEGVDRVVPGQFTFVLWDGRRVIFEAIGGVTNSPVLQDAPRESHEPVLRGEAVILGRGFARDRGLDIGDTIDIPTPGGLRSLPVAALVDTSFAISPGPVVLSLERMREWYDRDGATWMEVLLHDGADEAAVRRQIQDLVDASAIPAEVRTGEDLIEGTMRAVEQGNALFSAMRWVIVFAAGLAVLNTLTISVLERRRELGILRAIGSSRRDVRRLVLGEAFGIAVVGAILGLAIGTFEHWLGTRALANILGSPVDYAFVPSGVALGVLVAAGTAGLGAIGPAWRAGNVEIVDAIGYE